MKKILISTRHEDNEPNSFWTNLKAEYHTFGPIMELGNIPFFVPAFRLTPKQVEIYIQNSDILILMGGHDINPKEYKEEKMFDSVNTCLYRDNNEILLIHEAIKQGKPIIWICRGIQMINVALWGSLYQDIYQQYPWTQDHNQDRSKYKELYHEIYFSKDSFLAKLYQQDHIKVNSFHHQTIKELGKGLETIAKSDDGNVEAIQHISLPIYGVQRHPERSYFFDQNSIKLMEFFCNQ